MGGEAIAGIFGLFLISATIYSLIDRATTRPCPYCVKRIHRDATRCPHCTSHLEPPPLTGRDAEIQAKRQADDAARAAAAPAAPPVPAPAARPAAKPARPSGPLDLGIDLGGAGKRP